ncbi:MAG TPA: hypothetical protein VJV05_18010 [Pyrinomonadaceae bacterium]|nr:hypothetical protein [Pyrinomonadaceae bacterium]
MFSEAVLSCTPLQGTADDLHAAALTTIRNYHLPALVLGVGVLALFLLRRFKGIVILLFAIAALAISPGWSESAATLGPDCEPVGAFGVKAVLGVVAACFVGQLIFWIVERRRAQ